LHRIILYFDQQVQQTPAKSCPATNASPRDRTAVRTRLPAECMAYLRTIAIFTDRVEAAHIIRNVLLRQIAITNYVNPF
jgi:hypothetical protein